MIFNTKEEALQSRIKFIEKTETDEDWDDFLAHCKEYGFFNTCDRYKQRQFGKFFLQEKIIYEGGIHRVYYPKLSIYLNELPCDQTTEVEWVDYRPRTWEWNTEYKYTSSYNNKEYTNYVAELSTEVERLPLWWDDLNVYGSWNGMPDWKQLRQAYERTWWFKRNQDELREIQLNRLLK